MQHRLSSLVRGVAIVALTATATAFTAAPAMAGTTYHATEAHRDSKVSKYSGGHAFWSPNGKATFVDESGMFQTFDDGTARLTGTIEFNIHGQHLRFDADVNFTTAMTYDQYLAPQGHLDPDDITRHGQIKKELKKSAYVNGGGSVDPESFTFYYLDESDSTLTGLGTLQGYDLTLTQRPAGDDYGKMIFMFGEGANGKNTHLGLSGWLSYNYQGHTIEHGDINIDLTPKPVPTPSAAGLGLATLAGLMIRRRRHA